MVSTSHWTASPESLLDLLDLGQSLVLDLDGHIVHWTTGCQRLFGYGAKEAVGRLSHELLGTHFPQPMEEIRAQLEQNGHWEGELVHHHQDGRTVTVASLRVLYRDETGVPVAILEASHDITERKQTEEALREARQMFRLVLDTIPSRVFWKDRNSVFLGCNKLFAQDAGLSSPEQIIGHTDYDYPWREQAELYRTDDHSVIESGTSKLRYEEPQTTPDGRRIWVSTSKIPLRDMDNQIIGVMGTYEDVTERKRTEAELQKAKSAAEASSKAKDHFMAVLSHELRNPLCPVLATAAMLQQDAHLDTDTREQLEVIRRNVELEARLIDDLLDVTRIERGKIELHRQMVDLRQIISNAVEVCKPDIEARHLEFGVEAPDEPFLVDADAGRLQQVFWNLLRNAIKFTPLGGCVGMRCRREGNTVIAEVNDSGIGIDPHILPRIFNAFEQGDEGTNRQFGGLGLGLTISKAMVEMHGGTIEAHSEGKGKGASFCVRLPLVVSGPAPAAASPGETQSPPESPRKLVALRILLVEDHGDTVRIIRRLLESDGHKVDAAADVATALQLCLSREYDLLLSDLGLPDGSGLELMRSLRHQGIMLAGIALSGFGQEADINQSLAAGFTSHLTKPVDFKVLQQAIRQTMAMLSETKEMAD